MHVHTDVYTSIAVFTYRPTSIKPNMTVHVHINKYIYMHIIGCSLQACKCICRLAGKQRYARTHTVTHTLIHCVDTWCMLKIVSVAILMRIMSFTRHDVISILSTSLSTYPSSISNHVYSHHLPRRPLTKSVTRQEVAPRISILPYVVSTSFSNLKIFGTMFTSRSYSRSSQRNVAL